MSTQGVSRGSLSRQALAQRLARMSPQERRRLLEQRMRDTSRKAQFFELSFPQQRLWFLDQVEADGLHYRIHQAFDAAGELVPRALERAFRALVDRHEALRTGFLVHDGKPWQVVAPRVASPLPVVDLSGLESGERTLLDRTLVRRALRRSFDLRRGPLLRSYLFRLAPRRHRLLVDMHHIVSDGWSLGVLARELGALYRAFIGGAEQSPLPSLAVQYSAFARWQRETLDEETLARGLTYWKGKLAGAPELLVLPTDRPRPTVQSFRGALHRLHLPEPLGRAVGELARQRRVSPFMVLQAVFALLLGRIARCRDVVVGVPIANRTRTEFEGLIGFFVNTLALRTEWSSGAGAPSFASLLEQVGRTTLEAYDHQDIPFERLVEALRPERNRSHAPLVQVAFQLQTASIPPLELPGVTLEPHIFDPGVSLFDMNFQLEATPQGGLQGILQYATDLFDGVTVARFVGHFERLLTAALAAPEASCGSLGMLASAERQQLVTEFNPRPVLADLGAEETLHGRFAAQARRRPDAVAVSLDGATTRYGALEQAANRLAHHLRGLGVGPEVPVGVSMERSPELLVAILGILKAGGAYVPLDPVHPAGRLAYVLGDARPPVVVCDGAQAAVLGAASATGPIYLALDDPATVRALEAEPDIPPRVAVGADNLAYIIYTSGSTGQPKGTLIRHGNVLRLFTATEPLFGFGEDDVWTLFHSFAFDFSVWEIWGALLYGGRVVVVPYTVSRSPREFRRLLATEGVTVLNQTPSAFRQLVRVDQQAGPEEALALRFVIFGGEALELGSLTPWFERHGDDTPQLINMYGITETTVHVTYRPITTADLAASHRSPIGWGIPDLALYAVDDHLEPVPLGVPGELLVGSRAAHPGANAGLAAGYLERPALTAQRFIPDPFSDRPGARLYRSGDLVRVLLDPRTGREVEYLGRIDQQVQLRGFRIELGEIEAALCGLPEIREALVLVRGEGADQELVAYVVTEARTLNIPAIRAALKERLPEYMVPGRYVPLESIPLTANGKADRRALPDPTTATESSSAPAASGRDSGSVAPLRGDTMRTVARIWSEVLKVDRVGPDDNFFDLGGHSLRMVEVQDRLAKELGAEVSVVELFEYATVRSLVEHLQGEAGDPGEIGVETVPPAASQDIAIIAMTGRFPGSPDVETFWRNLKEGVEGISFFDDEEVEGSPLMPAQVEHPNFVKAAGVLEGAEDFDADLFGFTPREAELLDPQQRLFLEATWEALERAGYDARRYAGRIGVFAGVGMNAYFPVNLMSNPELVTSVGGFQMMVSNDKDFLPTRVSYQLGLRGPSVNIQTACSTSLVAVHLACQALRQGECEMALAGGVSVRVPQKTGYVHQTGMILSPDGHCRAFDADSGGIVGGNGLGVVVLKPLERALAEGDRIAAVIRGSAINNDGIDKVGYTAPSIRGQAAVIEAALADAGVDADTVGYVEAHGTGTDLGDPIEVAALTRVYRKSTQRTNYCGLGSVKTNVGHLDAAAGVTGLIKAALSVEHGQRVPSLHFKTPNPKLELETSPFYVVTETRPWESATPRRAGVSSFGIGGTNAHVVLEAAPEAAREPSEPSPRARQLLLLSAATPEALETATENLGQSLEEGLEEGLEESLALADVAFTLAVGRRQLPCRRMVVVESTGDAAALLAPPEGVRDLKRVLTGEVAAEEPTAVFLFPGQGAQYPGMGEELYRTEAEYRRWVDRCAELFEPHLGRDLRPLLLTRDGGPEAAAELRRTELAQPALFTVEYALARLWMGWGGQPAAMLGHSIGEWVAACLAGVFTLEDAIALVALRGKLMGAMEPGSMLTVALPEAAVLPYLGEEISVAAINAPGMTVVSGPTPAIEALAQTLEASEETDMEVRRLHTSHAFHSAMMAPAAEQFEAAVARVERHAPRLPYLSNVTGGWIGPGAGEDGADPTDPSYWSRHLRGAVRFADGAARLLEDPAHLFIEMGPGRTLQSLLRQQGEAFTRDGGRLVVGTLPGPKGAGEEGAEATTLLAGLGRVWLHGLGVDWQAFHGGERRHRVLLPTYPFERQRYWVEPGRPEALDLRPAGKIADPGRWFSVPTWARTGPVLPSADASAVGSWLLFVDGADAADAAEDAHAAHAGVSGAAGLAIELRQRGAAVILVRPGASGTGLVEAPDGVFTLDPQDGEGASALLAALAERGGVPRRIVHAWAATPLASLSPGFDREALARGYGSLLHLVRALVALPAQGADEEEERILTVVTRGAVAVRPGEPVEPARAALLGLLTVAQQEAPALDCRVVDLPPGESLLPGTEDPGAAVLLAEAAAATSAGSLAVAYRDGRRWRRTFEAVTLPPVSEGAHPRLTADGVYLITGGLGGVGFVLARWLARETGARLALLGRTPMPPREAWDALKDTDSGVSRRIRRVLELEALGAAVLIVAADVADREALAVAVAGVEARFGGLHGVIHAAGLSGEAAFRLLSQTDEAVTAAQLRPKIDGLMALEAVLGDRPLDFRMITSSISTVLGGLGFAAYAAANLAVDAYVERRGTEPPERRWLTVDWDGWQLEEATAGRDELAVTAEEGEEVVRRLLAVAALTDESRWIVSTGDLSRRTDRWLEPTALRRAAAAHREEAARSRSRGHSRPRLSNDFAAPRNAAEEALAAIWSDLLGIDAVGIHDDFFELGGHSLLVTQLLTRIRDSLGQDLEMQVIFTRPTIAELAAEMAVESGTEGRAEEVPPIVPLLRDGVPMRLSFAQERMWFLYRLEPEGIAYNLPAAIRLKGRLDPAALRRSFDLIAERHEALRTVFVDQGGVGAQRIEARRRYPLPVADLSGLPATERQREMLALVYRGSARPFRLETGPLLRNALLRLGADEHFFFTVAHHIISDGWSGPIFVRELAHFYGVLAGGASGDASGDAETSLPTPRVQYADYAEWQRDYVRGEVLESQLAYWRQQLGAPPAPLPLPYDRPRPADGAAPAGRFSFQIPGPVVAAIRARGQRQGATLFMVLMAAFQVLLHRYTGSTDVAVGSPIANRHRSGTEDLVGFFINTLVLRSNVAGDVTFDSFLEQVRGTTLGAFAHQDLPFDKVVEILRPQRGDGAQPLFQTMLAFNHEAPPSPRLPGLSLSLLDLDERSAQAMFDLVVGLTDMGSEIYASVEFNRALFDPTTVRRMMVNFGNLLAALAAGEATTPLCRLPLLSPAERHGLLWEASALVPRANGVVEALGERAQRALAASPGEARAYLLSTDGALVPLGSRGVVWLEVPGGVSNSQDSISVVPPGLRGVVPPGRLLATGKDGQRAGTGALLLGGGATARQREAATEDLWQEVTERRSQLSEKKQDLLAQRLKGKKRRVEAVEPLISPTAASPAKAQDSEAEVLWQQVTERRSQLSEKKQNLLAQRLRGKKRPSGEASTSTSETGSLVNIQPSGDGMPFTCVHAIAGDITHYVALAHHLGKGRPFYGLQAAGLDGRTPPLDRIESMAERYIAALRKSCPQGPYLLGGWSMGAVVAYDMACRLEAAGEPVELLALLEPSLPGGDGESRELNHEELIRRLMADLESLLGQPLEIVPEELLRLDRERQLEFLIREARRINSTLAELDRVLSPVMFDVYRIHVEALRRYRAAPYGGRVAIFSAAERGAGPLSPNIHHWRGLIRGELEVLEIPGNHTTMLQEPHVRRLASALSALLEGAAVQR